MRMFPEFCNDGDLWLRRGICGLRELRSGPCFDRGAASEAANVDGLDDELEWKSRELETGHRAEGVRLARKVSARTAPQAPQ